MKKIPFVVALLLSVSLFAQRNKDVPAFGKVEKAELQMKECDFDKDAEAVVLFDVGEYYLGIGMGYATMELERHVRIKILNSKGLDKADVHIPYYSYGNKERIKGLSAQTYNLDANGNVQVTKVEKKNIYEKKLNKRLSEEVFTFPEVKVGSIIEYKYTLGGAGLEDWYFQKSIPVRYSRYTISFPPEIEVYSNPLCVLPYERKKESIGGRDVMTFSMKNIPALRDEPFITCEDDYLQRIESHPIAINLPLQRINLVPTWPAVIKELMEDEDFGRQLHKEIPRTTDLDEQLKKVAGPFQKMVTIHQYVRNNMEWNGYNNIWAFDGVKAAWKEKKGTSGEINLILVNLLKDAGLSAYPILVSTHENGMISSALADYRQFNKVMAYVKLDERGYVLDATEKFTPAHLIPFDVMLSDGLVIEKLETFEWGWKTLWNEKQQFRDVVFIQGEVTEQNLLKGHAYLNSYDYSRVHRMPALKKGKDKFLEKYFVQPNPTITIDSLFIQNEEQDSLPLIQNCQFSQPVSTTADYKYFSLNLFTGLEKNPFVADTRFSDVFFGANQTYQLVAAIKVPEGYNFEELPRNVRMIMPDTSISISRFSIVENNQLNVRINLEFKRPYYSPDEYPAFREFYKKLFDFLNEQFAIRKKQSGNASK